MPKSAEPKRPPSGPSGSGAAPFTGDTNSHEERPAQFGLGTLLVAITAAGVLLGLLKAVGVFGALIAFLAAIVLTLLAYPRMRPRALAEQEALFDFVWGVIMPLICLAVDPIAFKHGDINLPPRPDQPWELTDLFTQAEFYPYSLAAYAFFGWQTALLTASLALGRPSRRWAAFLSGTFHVGFLMAILLGVLALLPSLLCLYVGIGLLGFTPLFTAYAFQRRMQRADAVAWSETRADAWLFGGIATTIALPLTVGVVGGLWAHLG